METRAAAIGVGDGYVVMGNGVEAGVGFGEGEEFAVALSFGGGIMDHASLTERAGDTNQLSLL